MTRLAVRRQGHLDRVHGEHAAGAPLPQLVRSIPQQLDAARARLYEAAVFVEHEDGVTCAGEQRLKQRVWRLSPDAG